MFSSFSDAVAAEVRAELARKRKSQAALAAHMKVSPMYISKRVNGGDFSFTVAEVDQIADFLEVPIAALLPAIAMAKAG
jgi:transcriptional regulator with XRE-family HTH domain